MNWRLSVAILIVYLLGWSYGFADGRSRADLIPIIISLGLGAALALFLGLKVEP